MKFRDLQSFFEDVLQPDADCCFSRAYLQIKPQRPPLGSVSSMEVNVDMLEQVDLLDMPDHEVLGDFLNFNMDDFEVSTVSAEQFYNSLKGRNSEEIKSGMSSTSSNSMDPTSLNSTDGAETPTVQSDEEEVQEDMSLLSTDKNIVTQSGKES